MDSYSFGAPRPRSFWDEIEPEKLRLTLSACLVAHECLHRAALKFKLRFGQVVDLVLGDDTAAAMLARCKLRFLVSPGPFIAWELGIYWFSSGARFSETLSGTQCLGTLVRKGVRCKKPAQAGRLTCKLHVRQLAERGCSMALPRGAVCRAPIADGFWEGPYLCKAHLDVMRLEYELAQRRNALLLYALRLYAGTDDTNADFGSAEAFVMLSGSTRTHAAYKVVFRQVRDLEFALFGGEFDRSQPYVIEFSMSYGCLYAGVFELGQSAAEETLLVGAGLITDIARLAKQFAGNDRVYVYPGPGDYMLAQLFAHVVADIDDTHASTAAVPLVGVPPPDCPYYE